MTLAQRIKSLEDDYWSNLGRLAAMQAAIFAIAGEPDPMLRLELLGDLSNGLQSTLLAQPITDEQLGLVERAHAAMLEKLSRGFERRLIRPEFRQPLPHWLSVRGKS